MCPSTSTSSLTSDEVPATPREGFEDVDVVEAVKPMEWSRRRRASEAAVVAYSEGMFAFTVSVELCHSLLCSSLS